MPNGYLAKYARKISRSQVLKDPWCTARSKDDACLTLFLGSFISASTEPSIRCMFSSTASICLNRHRKLTTVFTHQVQRQRSNTCFEMKGVHPRRGIMHCSIVPGQVVSDLYNRDPAGTDDTKHPQGIAQHDAEKFNSRPPICTLRSRFYILYDNHNPRLIGTLDPGLLSSRCICSGLVRSPDGTQRGP